MKKHTDTLMEQTKTKPQETLDFKMNKQMETFSFSPPLNLIEEGKWLLAVTSFEATNSVFNNANENNSFSISIPSCWRIPKYLEDNIFDQLKSLPKLKSKNDIELQVKEIRKRGNHTKIGDKEHQLSDFDTSKREILEDKKQKTFVLILKI